MEQKIVDVIKSYNEYSYDDILDTYSKWNTKDILYYCKVKQNHYELPDIMKDTKLEYTKAFLLIYNIQRKLDDKKPVDSVGNMYDTILIEMGIDDDEDDDDDKNEDQYDF